MSYSPEFSEYYSEEEEKPVRSVSTPTIKLKIKLNTANLSNSLSTEKKQKSKKKHRKKYKSENHNEKDHYVIDNYAHTGYSTTGGKRPYALINQEIQPQATQEWHNESGNDDDNDDGELDGFSDSYHPTDTKKSGYESFYSEEEDDSYQKLKKPKHASSAQLNLIDHQDSNLNKIPKEKIRRSSSIKPPYSATEKPKKRGRPTNKAKAAALLAQLPPKVLENPKRDLKAILNKLLDNLQKRDVYGFFLEPVDPKFVPDYLKVIKIPMAFTTMQEKLKSGSYTDVDSFRQDFNLIVGNAKIYNAVNTIYWKSADKLYEVGSKLIDKAEKQFDEEMSIAAIETSTIPDRQENKKAHVGRKDSLIKDEEVDIVGIDTNGFSLHKNNRQGSDATSLDIASSRILPMTKSSYVKKKKKKVTENGIGYGPDGSLHTVSGVLDLTSLLPANPSFCESPQLVTSNPSALPSAFYLNRQSAEDAYRSKHQDHSAHFLDYGAFTTLGHQPPGAFYTAQDASYIYPLFGDDRGEAYIKSLWQFMEPEQDGYTKNVVEEQCKHLTQGAWNILNETLINRQLNTGLDK
ncbi:hypothetical protein BY458DRAFT_492111 [Sporodiniella umbellata]|nr:hypothetical protein BY458DRAFT_492111 [Sporodiniella umbellata]